MRPGPALAEGCVPPPGPEHAMPLRAGAGAELAAGRAGAAAALAVPAGAVPLREARGAAVPAPGPPARPLRLVPAGAALLPGARDAAGAAQPAPPGAAGLPPALLPLRLALLLQVQVPPPGTDPAAPPRETQPGEPGQLRDGHRSLPAPDGHTDSAGSGGTRQ